MPQEMQNLYNCHKDRKTRPSLKEISEVLNSVITNYSRTFIVIDALDEYQVSNGDRKTLLSKISNLQAITRANLFATSRFVPEIVKELEGSVTLEIRASDEDVRRYLDGHMTQLPSFVLRSPDLQTEIKTEIVKAVDGMYVTSHAITVTQES